MANVAVNLIKILFLLLLIVALLVGGMLLVDNLGLYPVRSRLSPLLNPLGFSTPETIEDTSPGFLNRERLATRLEALLIQENLLAEREAQLATTQSDVVQEKEELAGLRNQLNDERESLDQMLKRYNDKKLNLEAQASLFNGMPPQQAVAQMNEMDSLLVVDILRTNERVAAENGEESLVAFWISQMPPERAAEINRLMVEKP